MSYSVIVNELMSPSGSPLTSKRVWALAILCIMACILYGLGMQPPEIIALVEKLAPIAFALVVGESIKDTVAESRKRVAPSTPVPAAEAAPIRTGV